jgi:hypothetical protein
LKLSISLYVCVVEFIVLIYIFGLLYCFYGGFCACVSSCCDYWYESTA